MTRPLTAFDLYFTVRCALSDRGVDYVRVWTRDDDVLGAVTVFALDERTRHYVRIAMTREELFHGNASLMCFIATQIARWAEGGLVFGVPLIGARTGR